MQPAHHPRGWVWAGDNTRPTGLSPSSCPIPQLWKRGRSWLQHREPRGDKGQCHISHPWSPSLSQHQGWTPLGISLGTLLHISGGISQGHVPMEPMCLSAWITSPPSAPASPVRTSCRCPGQRMRSGKAFSNVPPLLSLPLPPSHPSETPRVTAFIFSFQSLTLLLPGASHPLCPCGRGLVILPKCCAKPLGWLSHLGHLVPPAAHLGQGGEQSSLLGLQHPQCRTILVGRSLCRSLYAVLGGKSLLVLKFSQIWLIFCPSLHFLWFHHPQTVAWAFSSAPLGAVALLEGCRDPLQLRRCSAEGNALHGMMILLIHGVLWGIMATRAPPTSAGHHSMICCS